MAESKVNHHDLEPLPKAIVEYVPGGPGLGALFIQTPKPFLDGEEIAQGITVFYDKEDEDKVVGMMISDAEAVLSPFVDAILAKYGLSRDGTAVG